VVAAASQGPKALIENGKDGILVPVDDPEALAQAAARLIADKPLRDRLARRGAQRVELEFSEAAVVAQWMALFADYGAL
jgi:glycosyltransferase involved in cell wall biosynthesis